MLNIQSLSYNVFWFVCVSQGLHLCLLTVKGCASSRSYHDDSNQTRNKKLILKRLEKTLRRLKKQKTYLKEEIERLTDLLEECKKDKKRKRKTTTTTTPKPKIKKYVIRTNKVSYD